ncbi:MAG: exodeoxyribonuclease VII small subunit [Xanthomonadales bacterium]|nr:exodeoxyribonuclease VII small subunit [Xanthomonadales bacterium]
MSKKPKQEADFEKTLAELEKLVESLEQGDLSLDESLSGFKRGIELTRQCQSVLDNAEQTVQQLLDNQDDDSLEPFDKDA